MKLIAILLLVGCLQVSAKGYAQKITLHEKNAPLQKIFKEIRKQSGYLFLYTDELIRDARNTDVVVKEVPLEEALRAAFKEQPLTFTIVNKTIIVRRKEEPAPVPAVTLEIFAKHSIKGTVVDEDNTPISGASVVLNGSKHGTSTGAAGEFVLNDVNSGEYEIVVTSVGFARLTQKIRVRDESLNLTLTLTKSASRLDEIVVTAYGSGRQGSITGSVSTMTSKQLEHSPRASVQDNLQGNVSGVMVSTGSGQPGYSGNVRIRGIGSINAGNVPLYVVDGVPLYASDLNSLNTSDVASISVLKDASAATLYGSRAANGVIIITTKKGVAGKTQFSASAQTGSNTITNVQGSTPLNTNEMLELLKEGWVNTGKNAADFEAEMKANGVDPTINTDWFDALIRRGAYQQFDLSASGGNDKSKFYASASYYNAKAPMLGSDFKRYTTKINLSNQATSRFSFSLGLLASATKSNLVKDEGSNANPVRAYKRYQPWLRIYKDDGSYDLSYSNNYNPVAFVKENRLTQDRYNFLGNIGAKLVIINGLTLETQNSVDFQYSENFDYAKSGIGTARTNGGIADYGTGKIINFVSTNILRYKKDWGVHGLETFIGYEGQKIQSSGVTLTKRNFIPNTYTLDNASVLVSGGSSGTSNTLMGGFSNVSYNYDGRYYLSGSFRRDGSSRFGEDQKFGNFWSVGASWNVAAEKFMHTQKLFSDLRLRVTYGSNGNQSIGDFESRGLYGNTYSYDNNPGFALIQYGNELLTWEKNKPFNVGVDFGILNSRIQGSLEYYVRTTSALLLERPVSATNGVTSVMQNIGSMENSGIELEMNSLNIQSKENGFSWNTRFMFATLKNKITRLQSPIVGTFNRYEGGDFYQYYLPGFAGADENNGESLWYTDGTKSTTTNVYGNAARFNQGSALPDWYAGITNTFAFKGISLSFQFYGNFGNKLYDNWGSNSYGDGSAGFGPTSALPRYYYENRWQKAGDKGKQPKVMYRGSQSGSSNHSSTRFLYDGDYIRLRDITVGYELPKQWINNLHLGSARIYLRSNNLYTWLKDDRLSFDPEVGVDGYVDQNAPIYKTILVGLDIKF
ncbi:SusC/RagA family TonB-linked outer membrane protein [Pseudobacter ginsenosidimutans]|nr:SusC/RagA family TonB-linked outer membrane protein [Pseudobacter ginsenosidimutans]